MHPFYQISTLDTINYGILILALKISIWIYKIPRDINLTTLIHISKETQRFSNM
jgi:hypothetical protein